MKKIILTIIILALVIFFWPKYNGSGGSAVDAKNTQCQCIGIQKDWVAIGSWKSTCYGIPIDCQTTYGTRDHLTTISEIKNTKPTTGNFIVEGYVVKIYTCPSCPPGAQCKPCMKNNIIISTNNNLLETYDLSDNELILFINDLEGLELGKKYEFSINILDYKSTLENINDIKIAGWNPIE